MNKTMIPLSVLAALVLLTSASGTAMAASQKWYPDHNGGIQDSAYRNTLPPEGEYQVSINDGTSYLWTANEAALVDVSFGSETWIFNFDLNSNFKGKYQVQVGTYDGAVFTPAGSASFTQTVLTRTLAGAVPMTSDFTVPTGEYLAFRVVNTPETTAVRSNQMVLATGVPGTAFTSPASDPGYPTPEFGTFVLAGAGLGLVALVVSRRR